MEIQTWNIFNQPTDLNLLQFSIMNAYFLLFCNGKIEYIAMFKKYKFENVFSIIQFRKEAFFSLLNGSLTLKKDLVFESKIYYFIKTPKLEKSCF